MANIAFRSPVTVPLLRQNQAKPEPPDPRAHDTFRITKRANEAEPTGPGGKHMAIDIGNFRCSDPIVAMAGGIARRTHDEAKKFGAKTDALGVIVDHGSGVTSEYWHLKSFIAKDGARVEAGAAVGLVGKTGRAEFCHCHIEIKVKGVRRDPEPFAFGKTLSVGGTSRAGIAALPGGHDMPLSFKASDYRPITNRKYLTDLKARFRSAPNTRAVVIKTFPGNTTVIPSGVVKGESVPGGMPRAGFKPTDWFEARMKVGTTFQLGYFHASVLTRQTKVE
jgi:murein DD-endopeptidase MepM/ murein hydrolase activator NlpD